MMSNEEVRGRAVWRRAIVPIAATAATVIGGMVIATPATAATPSVSVTAPASLASDGLAVGSVIVKADNTGGTDKPQSDLIVTVNISKTDFADCSKLSLTPATTAPAGSTVGLALNPIAPASPFNGVCQYRVFKAGVAPAPNTYFDFAASAQSLAYDLKVDGNVPASGPVAAHFITSPISITASVISVDTSGNNTGSLAGPSAAANTNLVAPAATIALTQKAAGSITNNGDSAQTYVLAVTNPADTGLTGTANPSLSFTAPVGVTMLSVSQDAGATWADATAGATAGTFTFAPAAITGLTPGTNVSKEYVVKVKTVDTTKATTGNLTVQATLTGPALVGGTPSATSGTVSTAIVGPTAPTFNATPPAATIYQAYRYTVVNNAGTGVTAYYAACVTTNNTTTPASHTLTYAVPNGGTQATRPVAATAAGNAGAGDTLALGKFSFNAKTGAITATPTNTRATDSTPDCQWYLIANNGVGGATAASGVPADKSTPDVALHDVQINFALPILFSDTPVNSTFGPEIYALSEMPFNGKTGSAPIPPGATPTADWSQGGVIGGYADGTFRGSLAVTRQAFAHFLAGLLNNELGPINMGSATEDNYVPRFPTGNCPSYDPSAFKDVPNTSTFCQDIKSLAAAGIINGYADGGFHPGALISRQAMSAFVYRTDAVQRGVPTSTISDAACTQPIPFNDFDASNQFCGDIEWMATNKITTGYADGGFHPLGNASRQATAAFLGRLWSMWNPA